MKYTSKFFNDIEKVATELLADKSVKQVTLTKETGSLLITPIDENDLARNEYILVKYPSTENGNPIIDGVIVRRIKRKEPGSMIKVIENEEEYFEDIEYKKRRILNYLKLIKDTDKKLNLSIVDRIIMDLLCIEDGIVLEDFSKEVYVNNAYYTFEYNDEPLKLKVTFDKASMSKEKPYVFVENIEFI